MLNPHGYQKINIKKLKKEFGKQPVDVTFNHSGVKLTPAIAKVLNQGLNFSILPLKMDLTQLLVDFKRFERTMIWWEFWYGRQDENKSTKPIFKTKKLNLPRNYNNPNGLQ